MVLMNDFGLRRTQLDGRCFWWLNGVCVDASFVTFLLINVDVRRRGYASCLKKKCLFQLELAF